jgi:dihydroorotate dehydrogenase electron transfer subunit
MLDRKARVKILRDLGAGNFFLTLNSPEQARLTQPGQFVMLKCTPDINAPPLLRRPFTVFDVHPHPKTGRPTGLDLLVKDVGIGTHNLVAMRAGDELWVLGPQGRPFQISADMRHRIRFGGLVGGGVGIAALLLLAKRLLALEITPVLFYGGRSSQDLVLREAFEALGLRAFYTTEDGSLGERGVVTSPVERFLQKHARQGMRLYACGPWGMMKATHALAERFAVTCEVSLEARMGCSLGACMGCVIRSRDGGGDRGPYIRVCQEGPVMDSAMVDWDTPPL